MDSHRATAASDSSHVVDPDALFGQSGIARRNRHIGMPPERGCLPACP